MTTQRIAPTTEELPKDVADLAAAVAHLPAEFRSLIGAADVPRGR